MPLFGVEQQRSPYGVWSRRVVIGISGDGTTVTPIYPPLYLKPTAAPSGVGAVQGPRAGSLYFDSTANALYQYNGSAWAEVGTAPAGSVTIATGKTFNTTDPAALREGGIIIPRYELIQDVQNQVAAASYAVSHSIFVCDSVSGTYQVAGVTVNFGTASTSGTLQVEVATGTQAPGSGTNQLTGTISLSGTANTPVNGTLIGSPTTIAAGNRVNLIFAGTVTGLANTVVTVALQRLS